MATIKNVATAAIDAAKQLRGKIKEASDSLREKRSELCAEQARLQQHNEALYRQPVRRDDVKALVLLAIDRWGTEFLLENWAPVLKDFATPIGPRPKTLDAKSAAYDKASAAVTRARESVARVERQIADQQRAVADAYAAAERGEEYRRPAIGTISPDELTSAKRVLSDAERTLSSIERPGSVSLNSRTFERSNAPMMVQDAAVILDGGHTGMLASFDGEPVIDHYRNIFSGALLPDVPLLARANQAIAAKGACFFLGDVIKAKVEKHFDSIVPADDETETPLLSLEECRAAIARNEQRIDELQGEIDEVDTHLKAMQAS